MDLSPEGRPRGGRTDLVVLALTLAASGLLASLSPDGRAAVTAEIRATLLSPFVSAHAVAHRQLRLSRTLAEVRRQRDSLARALARIRTRASVGRDLEDVLGASEERSADLLTVRLEPGRRRVGEARSFTLGAGRRRGVTPPAGVLAADGLLGVVRWAGDSSARGQFWTHPDFRVSVRTRSGDASGIVRPSFEGEHPVMLMEGAPYQQEIPAGTVLVTSGLGGVYPPGIPVGTVRSVSSVESGWEKSYRVEAAVRPEQTDVALVWLEAPPSP